MDIQIENLNKSYEDLQVLRDFNATIKEGETTCIMGPSGCGKTTLLRILLGLEEADSGQVLGLEDKNVRAVFQEDRLCENLSARANLWMVCPDEKKIQDAMLSLKLEDAFHKPVRELSGGMKRRVAILRALLADSDCIFMDEPLKGLDEDTKELTAQMLVKMTEGKTLVVITHEKNELDLLSSKQLLQM